MNAYHLTKIKQHFPQNSIADIKAEVARELVKLRPFIKPDAQIAIAIGSRGIKNLVPVLKEVSKFIMEHNARPRQRKQENAQDKQPDFRFVTRAQCEIQAETRQYEYHDNNPVLKNTHPNT